MGSIQGAFAPLLRVRTRSFALRRLSFFADTAVDKSGRNVGMRSSAGCVRLRYRGFHLRWGSRGPDSVVCWLPLLVAQSVAEAFENAYVAACGSEGSDFRPGCGQRLVAAYSCVVAVLTTSHTTRALRCVVLVGVCVGYLVQTIYERRTAYLHVHLTNAIVLHSVALCCAGVCVYALDSWLMQPVAIP